MSKRFLGISPKTVGVLVLTLGVALASCSAKTSPLDGTWEMDAGIFILRVVCSGDTWTMSVGSDGTFLEGRKGTLKVEGKTIIATLTHEKGLLEDWRPTTEEEPIKTWTLSDDGKTLTIDNDGITMEFTKK